MKESEQTMFNVQRAYRDVFGLCAPSIIDFPKDAICDLGINALMRGSPVTHEELQAWIAENTI